MSARGTISNQPTGRLAAAGSIVRSIALAGIAGLFCGILVGGLGERLVMRLAALADPSADGALTDNGNRVGEITSGGTLELVIFGGIFTGFSAGIIWVMVRPWLSRLGSLRPLGAAVVAAAVGGFTVIEVENPDFAVLDPSLLTVTMFMALVGAALSATDSFLDGRIPAANRFYITGGYVALVVLGAPLLIPTVLQFFSKEFCTCDNPPRVMGAFVLMAGILTTVSWAHLVTSGSTVAAHRDRLQALGELAVAGAVIAGTLYTAQEIADIV